MKESKTHPQKKKGTKLYHEMKERPEQRREAHRRASLSPLILYVREYPTGRSINDILQLWWYQHGQLALKPFISIPYK